MQKITQIKQLQILIFTLFITLTIQSQISLPFNEDFEAASGTENATNVAGGYLGWEGGQFATTPPTNDNYFWVMNGTSYTTITGNYSLGIIRNDLSTTGTTQEYRANRRASTIVYYNTLLDATNFTNVTMDFNWVCEGEEFFDFGRVLYSFDGNTWAALPGFYENQSTIQNVTGLDLSVVDGQQFYIGFGWDNDNSAGGYPGFIVDDISITGTPLPACINPDQPTVLNLTATGDTVSGSFTASANADNYLVVVNTTNTVPVPVDGTSYNIGDTIGAGNIVADIDNDTSFTATGLNPSTTYYVFIFAYDAQCVNGPTYTSSLDPMNSDYPLTGDIPTTNTTYCSPIYTNDNSFDTDDTTLFIDDVEFIGTLNDVFNNNNGTSFTASGYSDYTAPIYHTEQAQGEGVNIFVGIGSSIPNGMIGRYQAWVDWNKDGDFLDTDELVFDSGATPLVLTTTFGFVIPDNQNPGLHRVRIRYNAFVRPHNSPFAIVGTINAGPCTPFDFINSGGTNNDRDIVGETEDYILNVIPSCSAKITSISDGSSCGPGPATLNVTGSAGVTQYNWYDAETGGNLVASTTTGSWTPVINATTTYWVTATDGNCESLVRTKIIATLDPITELTFTPESPVVCGEDDVIEVSATGDMELAFLIDEDFESGGLGVFTNNNVLTEIVGGSVNGAAVDNLTRWQNRTSTYVPLLDHLVWFPAISSGFGANQFVMSTSDVAPPGNAVWEALESPVVDASNFSNLTLKFDIYFSKYNDGPNPTATEDEVLIYLLNGGTRTLIGSFTTDMGYGTEFATVSLDLSAYTIADLQFSIDYSTNVDENSNPLSTDGSFGWNDGVAIDNVQLFGSRPLNPSFDFPTAGIAFEDAAATIPYTNGTQIGSVYVKPTLTQLEQPTITFTADASLSNGCNISKDISITNNTKIWNGNIDSSWENANNWYPSGVPTSSNCVIVSDYNNTGNPSPKTGAPIPPNPKYAYNLRVKSDGVLELGSQRYLTVTDAITIDSGGLFYMENNSSLVQINNVTNSGEIFVERAPANASAIDNLNYVYWSSPVSGFEVNNISPDANTGQKWQWLPTTANTYGNWDDASGLTMTNGKGYIVRGLSGVVPNPRITLTSNSALFNGVPNNGDISIPIYHGNYNSGDYPGFNGVTATNSDDNWNLIGNPFPSSISADAFIDANAAIIEDDPASAPIIGAIWFWPHAGIPLNTNNDPFYDDFEYNYGDQYIKHNKTGTSIPGGPTDVYIASGQAFFVLADHSADPNGADSVVFNNTMRNETYSNSNFFEAPPNTDLDNTDNILQSDKNRIWLDLLNSNNNAKSILIGYVQDATNGNDRMFDAPEFSGSSFSFYSLIEEDIFSIQGKSLPFINSDIVNLGLVLPENDIYSIAINTLDGLFLNEEQGIFIHDLYTNIIHDLRESPYSFSSEEGTFNDRFQIIYSFETLNISQNLFNDFKIIQNNTLQQLTILNPNSQNIKSVNLIDVTGKQIFNFKDLNVETTYTFSTANLRDGVYIASIILENDKILTEKIIVTNKK